MLGFLSLKSTYFMMAQDEGDINFQLVGLDTKLDTSLEKDLRAIWIGESDDYLYFIIRFGNVTYENPIEVNITISNELDEKYLISAFIFQSSFSLYVAHSVSLTGDAVIPEGDTYFVQYIDQRMFYFEGQAEVGLFVDWLDIGGQTDFDVVSWSNRSIYANFDKMPDASFFTFSGVTNIDRSINFEDALKSDFSSLQYSKPLFSTLDETITITEQPKTTNPVVITDPNGEIIPTFFIIYIIIFVIFLGLWYQRRKTSAKKIQQYPPGKKTMPKSNPFQRIDNPQSSVDMKFIDELDREVRMCCYQTARLNEAYCWCGRAIPTDLSNIFASGK